MSTDLLLEMAFIAGSSDQPIPEGDDANGSNTSDNTKSDDTANRKSHHVISDWRTFRANLVAQEQVSLLFFFFL